VSTGTKRELQIKRKVPLTIVGILIVIILVLLAIYLFQRVR
jgi:flagellar biogenesis protein FliO